MSAAPSWALLALSAVAVVLLLIVLVRPAKAPRGGALRDELRAGREEAGQAARASREELQKGLTAANETLAATLTGMGAVQRTQLEGVTKRLQELADSNRTSLDQVRTTVDLRFRELQEGNEKKLEEMRKTVDEKLHVTLEKRLGESFKLVSDQLESVQKGLGEMQALATGVGDLKRVLTNVKARGTWAEVQLEGLLDQILAPGQYQKNVHVKKGSAEMVEFAVKLPGPKDEPDTCVWLPIDSKFPQEDYVRIQEAAELGDPVAAQKATEALARAIKLAALDIHDKYLDPPHTTDFALLFLGTEGLYAEVLRQPALVEDLQQRLRIVVAGPTTLAALLSSLRMGFQTLAIEQQAAEVWRVLGAVKSEFAKFGQVLDRVKKQLDTASRTIEKTGARTRAMERKLRSVEQLSDADSVAVLGAADLFVPAEPEGDEEPDSEDEPDEDGPAAAANGPEPRDAADPSRDRL